MARKNRLFFIFWSLAFLLFSLWQLNDPDPEIWVSIYSLAAFMCGLAAFEKYFLILLVLISFSSLIGGIFLFPQSVTDWVFHEWQQANLSMKTLEMEKARESFGLLIVSGVMGLAAYSGWRKKQSSELEKRGESSGP